MGKKTKAKDKTVETVETSRPVVRAKAKTKEPEPEPVAVFDEAVEESAEENGGFSLHVNRFMGGQDSTSIIPLLHRLLDTVEKKTAIPVVQQECPCGGALSISEALPEADRKRIHNAWVRQHKPCVAGAVDTAE